MWPSMNTKDHIWHSPGQGMYFDEFVSARILYHFHHILGADTCSCRQHSYNQVPVSNMSTTSSASSTMSQAFRRRYEIHCFSSDRSIFVCFFLTPFSLHFYSRSWSYCVTMEQTTGWALRPRFTTLDGSLEMGNSKWEYLFPLYHSYWINSRFSSWPSLHLAWADSIRVKNIYSIDYSWESVPKILNTMFYFQWNTPSAPWQRICKASLWTQKENVWQKAKTKKTELSKRRL